MRDADDPLTRREPAAAIKVWADVGGTFTDCFVIGPDGVRETKVLSSGIVRASVERQDGPRGLILGRSGNDLPDRFWEGARLSVVRSDGTSLPLGTVCRHDAAAATIRIDRELDRSPWNDGKQVVELDADLEAPVLAARMLLGIPLSKPLPALDVRLGTTRGTNALLTRRGARTALLVTAGFADILRIGEQNRPDLFSLAIEKVSPLTDVVIEVQERLDAKGNVLKRIDLDDLRRQLTRLREVGIESLSICLLHAHVNDVHERAALQAAREAGWTDVSLSSEVSPLIKLVSRAETTTLDAYLNPVLASYVGKVGKQFLSPVPSAHASSENGPTVGDFSEVASQTRFRLMTSGGNLVTPAAFRGRDSILSGPAGGVVALASVARAAGASAAIGLDMGGTSTDVSRYEGRVGRRYQSLIGGVRVMTPMMDIHTVAAGGGSICRFSHGRMHVGPESAGADPGPACYGRGGPLTITDVNLLLGRFPQDRFPLPLDRDAAQARLVDIARQMHEDKKHPFPMVASPDRLDQLADGFLQIAVTHMAEAVRTVSTAEGTDPREMTLVGFGGAAGQHLCRVADALQMRRILDHPHAGMLSALGMGLANVGRVVTRGVYQVVDETIGTTIEQVAEQLRDQAESELLQEQSELQTSPDFQWECDLRYVGTESALSLSLQPTSSLSDRFHHKHRQTFGYHQGDRDVELVSIRCEATLAPAPFESPKIQPSAKRAACSTIATRFAGHWQDVDVVDRARFSPGQAVVGPVMIVSDYSTLLVEPNWRGSVLEDGTIELIPGPSNQRARRPSDLSNQPQQQSGNEPSGKPPNFADDPVLLEVVARRLQGIADSMGEVLRRTSVSVNVKERRDYSCAVFRGDGSLIANAPHVPVHLGAMGHTVRQMMRAFPEMFPGDCYLSNDPFAGGSHLPDVTVVTPIFCDSARQTDLHSDGGSTSGKPDFFVASRAHHAEIGGRTPGSMPPDATSLAEEGVLIRDFALHRDGTSHIDSLRQLLSSGRYPSRSVEENLADIAAQQAAGTDGAAAMQQLAKNYSVVTIDALMGRLLEVAGDSIADWIESLPQQPMTFQDALDDGTKIAVKIFRQTGRLLFDFDGTAGVHPHCFNATPSIVTAAVLYVLRCVSGADLPLCDGVLRDVELRIPQGLLNPPSHDDPAQCAAVVAGNVETSQRVVDVLLGALGLAAASQGTMNNVLIGDDTFGYYETIGGGSGATASHPGAHAVHTHMTNTRITDPEVLESRLPIRLHRFAIRTGSGGAGRYRGGDGMIREFEFLRALHVSLITNRRTIAPYGIDGGSAGSPGENLLVQPQEKRKLPSSATIEVAAGDRLIIQTPGGGGWGQ